MKNSTVWTKYIYTQKMFLKNALLWRERLLGLVDTSIFRFKQSSWVLIWVNGDRNSNRDPTLSLLKSMLVCHNLIGVRMRPLMQHSHAYVLLGSDSSSWPSFFQLCKYKTKVTTVCVSKSNIFEASMLSFSPYLEVFDDFNHPSVFLSSFTSFCVILQICFVWMFQELFSDLSIFERRTVAALWFVCTLLVPR